MKRRHTRSNGPIDRIAVSRAVKLGHLPELARSLGVSAVDLVTEARRQYVAGLDRAPDLPEHLRANTAVLIAELDEELRSRIAHDREAARAR